MHDVVGFGESRLAVTSWKPAASVSNCEGTALMSREQPLTPRSSCSESGVRRTRPTPASQAIRPPRRSAPPHDCQR